MTAMANILFPRWALFLLLFLSPPIIAGQSSPSSVTELNRIVAVVNSEAIVLSELNSRMRTKLAELSRSGTKPPPPAVLRKKILDRLIIERIQFQVSKRIGIRIDDDQVNRTIANIAKRNELELRQFREILERDGYKFTVFQEDIRRQLVITELQKRQVANRVQVTDREVDNYLATHSSTFQPKREYRLAHMLIAVSKNASPGEVAIARKKVKRILRQLRNDANFANIAKLVSDSGQAPSGGDLGWRDESKLPRLFADIVSKLEPGEISEPLRNASGFHIIKLIATRDKKRHVIPQTKARHILVKASEMTSDADAKTRLEQIRERIIQGEDFKDMARSHSDDRGSAIKGGNIGWVGVGDVVPKFEQAMDKLQPMEISEPFRTQFGWHIVQVLDRRKHDGSDDIRRAKAIETIRGRKIEEELSAWLRQLRDEAYVEYRLEEE
uniref:Chaperone SurA n=1 Tax=Candidatus Kentrum sp. SD TaxID=2126332 RepID=A0A450YKQ0_9GAMM|nr:MAG: periplasmic chaperone for outer membrane proteins SurA [Candidatus Kentron sp. SD]VFK42086.1 MAG: periplasmic chaperone for outer membrane proteins SurA [Candidatus Kentron sp. SD]